MTENVFVAFPKAINLSETVRQNCSGNILVAAFFKVNLEAYCSLY